MTKLTEIKTKPQSKGPRTDFTYAELEIFFTEKYSHTSAANWQSYLAAWNRGLAASGRAPLTKGDS